MWEPEAGQQQPEQLAREIKALDWRDLELWGIGACVLFALASGFVLLLTPQLIWKFSASAHSTNLPLYTWGLVALLLLLNAQTLQQRLRLQKMRAALVRQLQAAERAAQVDSLTGVFNRRYMEAALEKEIQRVERYRTGLCLAVIDVDRFKEFNTRFGHVEGDRVLTVVADLLRKNFRTADTVVRYVETSSSCSCRKPTCIRPMWLSSGCRSTTSPNGIVPMATTGIPSPSPVAWPNSSRE